MSKKEKQLYLHFGKKWDVYVFHKITLSEQDSENIIKCHELLCKKNCVALKRETKRIKFFKTYLYFNTLYGGLDIWN